MGAYMMICVWIFMATLIGFNRINTEPTIRERVVPAGWLLLQSVPLMLVLFFLFPRLSSPLWSMPQENAARTGLSDTMSPGDISKLSQSDAVAFRVEFDGAVPNQDDLYWRGPVMGNNTGRTWGPYYVMETTTLDYTTNAPPTRYRVTMQPHAKPWLFALDMPGTLPPDAIFTADYQIRARRPVTALLAYEMTSYLRFRAGTALGPRETKSYLAYPTNINPRTIALGKSLRTQYPDPLQLIDVLLKRYNTEFIYSLEPPLLGANPMDEFLFDTKQGFCEHYAGSFALVMRAAGIPARVVTGYQGGEVNPVSRQLVVRQAEAHAWTEVWLDDRGWTRVDPTFAVSPLRINRGIGAALGPQGMVDSLIEADKFGLLRQVRFGWDAVNTQWNAWVIGFTQDRQKSLLENLGVRDPDWRTLAVWLIVGVFLASGSVGIFLLAKAYGARKPPVLAAYDRFCAKLAKHGLARAPHEGPMDYLARIERERPTLAAETRAVIEAYLAARYHQGAGDPAITQYFQRVVARFRVD